MPATALLIPSLGRRADDFAEIAAGLARLGIDAVPSDPPPAQEVADGDLGSLARLQFAPVAAGEGPVVVVGHAYGNWLARMAAVLFPERIVGLVLLAAARRSIPVEIKGQIDICIDPERRRDERLESLEKAYFAPGNDAGVWLDGWDRDLAVAQRRAAARSDRALWWDAGGKVPILDVQAREDAISPFALRNQLRDELGSRVEVAVVEKAGHALLPENPGAVVKLIAEFMRAHGWRKVK